MELQELVTTVVKLWPFDAVVYPDLSKLDTPAGRLNFTLKHLLTHLQGEIGELAKLCERSDHTGCIEVTPAAVLPLARNLLVDALRLVDLVGLSGQDLVRALESWAQKKQARQQLL